MEKDDFRRLIYEFYKKNRRSFPWRETNDPWLILLSEMMLQQTQTSRVATKWESLAGRFPNPQTMADVELAELLSLWSGLGYNRRALALKKIAERVVSTGGSLPDTYDGLVALPMIGPYTAKAVLAFAYNRPVVFIETNIRRIFIHHFFPDQEKVTDRQILPLVEETLDRKDPRNWYYALMDYGSALRGVENPNRRSAHYSRQSTFEGSDRQKRGALLRLLTASQGRARSCEELSTDINADPEKTMQLLSALVREGFVAESPEGYRIPS
ncbi:HhH-GPD family protein [Sediminispirochaeta smaragdinae]|uniref:HhH-GPD family protein n=1 Tax=Sediminispirochaeta smaragdinae (strain DSM 11293 / JCM 15392 / SEBR 4228) TaxID=573413 RepID=E1R1M9_SEDSS|nr:base excision DNA repair protein [Sediminispirochaeta smaragdinae]ADK81405.1 HhH-GPD family protein [Sediminispirochaeta smaragdinae DSM 11293]